VIVVTYNEYLDRRDPRWVDAEVLGRVAVDRNAKLITIRDAHIERAFLQRS